MEASRRPPVVGLKSAPSGGIACSSVRIEFDGEPGVKINKDLREKEELTSAWNYLDITSSCLKVESFLSYGKFSYLKRS